MLASLVLTFNHRTGRNVCDSDCGFGFVDVLTACSAGTEGVYLQVGRTNLKINLFGFGQYGNGNGRGVDSSLRFSFGNTLNSVNSALKFKA